MKTSSAKAKGRRLQQEVRNDLLATFPWLTLDDVQSRPTSSPGEDVMLSPAARAAFPFSVECKNVERLNVHQAFAQAVANAKQHTPLLVLSRNRCSEPLAVLRWSDLLRFLGPGDAPAAQTSIPTFYTETVR